MTKLHITAAAVLLSTAILLGGCAEQAEDSNQISDQSNVSDTLSGSSSDNSFNVSDTLSSDSSSDNSSSNPKPDIELTFTEQDLELQAILKELTANAMDIDGIFTRLNDQGEKYPLKVNDTDYSGAYYPIAENRKTEPSGLFTVPQTRSELEQLLLTCFTSRASEYYIEDIGTGHVITDTDGTHALNEDYDMGGQNTFIEADGLLYRISRKVYDQLDIDYTTAKVISKTDKTIKFSYSGKSDTSNKTDGVIMLENGSWKLDFFHGEFIPEMPTEFTDEDLELQAVLDELSPGCEIFGWYFNGGYSSDKYVFFFDKDEEYGSTFYLMPEKNQLYYQELDYPKTYDELEQLSLKYFTRKSVDMFMTSACKGTITENTDGKYFVTLDKEDVYPIFIEIDGRMYFREIERGGFGTPDFKTAKVIEKNESRIKFSYTHQSYTAYYYTDEGLIKYERGGWRLNFGGRGFDTED